MSTFLSVPVKRHPLKSAPFLGIFATPSSPKKLYPPLSPPKHLWLVCILNKKIFLIMFVKFCETVAL